jgi:hypothetical protein
MTAARRAKVRMRCEFTPGLCVGLLFDDHEAILFLAVICICFDWRG